MGQARTVFRGSKKVLDVIATQTKTSYNHNMIIKKCEYCLDKFYVYPSGLKQRFCSSKCRAKVIMAKGRMFEKGQVPHNYKGKIIRKGYIVFKDRTSNLADKQGYVKEHRKIMQDHIGRDLLKHEIVHHINGDKQDNRIENLMLLQSNSEHRKFHKGNNKRVR